MLISPVVLGRVTASNGADLPLRGSKYYAGATVCTAQAEQCHEVTTQTMTRRRTIQPGHGKCTGQRTRRAPPRTSQPHPQYMTHGNDLTILTFSDLGCVTHVTTGLHHVFIFFEDFVQQGHFSLDQGSHQQGAVCV